MQIIYNLFGIPLQYLLFHLLGLFNQKIRAGIQGRRHLFPELTSALSEFKNNSPRIWIHNSSLGEYEQARPVIIRLKEKFPNCVVIVSFFSPSGYDQIQGRDLPDYVTYLPFDSKRNARKYLGIVNPDIAIVIRHDFWPNHLWALQNQNIPSVLVNCNFRDRWFYKVPFLLPVLRKMFEVFDLVMLINDEVKAVCDRYQLSHIPNMVTGDTKYDQVIQRAQKADKEAKDLFQLKGNRKGIVVGSSWPEDEAIILPAVKQLKEKGYKIWIVMVPHEPSDSAVEQLIKKCETAGLSTLSYSEFLDGVQNKADILIIDQIGLLASLYQLGEIAFVGGGFATGLHNVLEPAAHGIAVLFGPLYHHFNEAVRMVEAGVGISVTDQKALFHILDELFGHPEKLQELGKKARAVVDKNVGATDRIVEQLAGLIEKC